LILLLICSACKKEQKSADDSKINMPYNSKSGRINSIKEDEPFGYSVAISSDGNTAIVGAYSSYTDKGGAYVYVRNNNTWSLQANLIGSSSISDFRTQLGQGISVAISADGNTAIFAAEGDYTWGGGTAFIFVRNGNIWTQQKAISKVDVDDKNQVSITLDGNTVVVKSNDLNGHSELLTFERNGIIWNQKSAIVIDAASTTNNIGAFAISGDGNILAICKRIPRGGGNNFDYDGRLFVYGKSGNNWVKQGAEMTPSPSTDEYYFGTSLSISDVDNTIIVGTQGPDSKGGAYIFKGVFGTWIQSGNKLTSDIDPSKFKFIGGSVAISGDGYTAVIEGSIRADANDIDPIVRKNVLFVYSLVNNNWQLQGDYIIDNTADIIANADFGIGYSISLSGNGKIIFAGNSLGGKVANKTGYIEFFYR
jgi:FG-GAP repeat